MLLKAIKTIMTNDGTGRRVTYRPGDVYNAPDKDAILLLETGSAVKMDRKVNISIKTNVMTGGDKNDH